MSDAAVRSTKEWMRTQQTLGDWAPVAHVPGEGLDDDPTPRGVVRAALGAAMPHTFAVRLCTRPLNEVQPLRVVGVGSGYGCWESELARWCVEVLGLPRSWLHITAIELNPEREPHLRKWCDQVVTRDWFEALRDHHELPTWDLAIGNPPFKELLGGDAERESDAAKDGGWFEVHGPPAPLGMPGWLLEHCPAVLLYHTQQAFLKSEAGRACWRGHPPAASWLVPGGVKHRGPGEGADSRCYQVTLWLRGGQPPSSVYLLDDLSPAERSWTVPPGSESIEWARANGYPLAPEWAAK